jgi:phosphoribosylformylglycinamidine synthase subunit PurQ / glutaminase
MNSPKVMVLSGYGLNCEEETLFAFELSGAEGVIVHINDLIANPKQLDEFNLLALPGGFSYGDDTGSGNAYANKLQHHLGDVLQKFVARDTLMIGICNGFQIMSNLGLVPAVNQNFTSPTLALTPNDKARYIDRWVDLSVDSQSPWLRNTTSLSLPVAHGEGKFFTDEATLNQLRVNGQIAMRYQVGEVSSYLGLLANPNGSLEDIAGITDPTGRILGMMPHPERAIFFTQLPHWPALADKLKRNGQPAPEHGPGLQLFKNAVKWFS